jgi:hypothetical protein
MLFEKRNLQGVLIVIGTVMAIENHLARDLRTNEERAVHQSVV